MINPLPLIPAKAGPQIHGQGDQPVEFAICHLGPGLRRGERKY